MQSGLLDIAKPSFNTRCGRETSPLPLPHPGERFEQKKVCSNPLQREVRARRIYILTRLTTAREGKQRCGGEQAGNAWNRQRAVVPGFRVNLCVCVCLCVYKSMRDGFLSLSSSAVFHSSLFQVPLVALDGLFDAQQQRGVPLVQAGDGVELFHLRRGGKKQNKKQQQKKRNNQSFVLVFKVEDACGGIAPSHTKSRSYHGKLIKLPHGVKLSLSTVY